MMSRWRDFLLFVTVFWGISAFLGLGILLWGFPPVLIFVIPVFVFPILMTVVERFMGEARGSRDRMAVPHRHH